mmetsp:Transcript_16571/g.49597  ORF Transcript_16571/g.49597 Transcript_16571/m.49597 type:complete len:139 (-) Transcript_16571:2206-2622(-)
MAPNPPGAARQLNPFSAATPPPVGPPSQCAYSEYVDNLPARVVSRSGCPCQGSEPAQKSARCTVQSGAAGLQQLARDGKITGTNGLLFRAGTRNIRMGRGGRWSRRHAVGKLDDQLALGTAPHLPSVQLCDGLFCQLA